MLVVRMRMLVLGTVVRRVTRLDQVNGVLDDLAEGGREQTDQQQAQIWGERAHDGCDCQATAQAQLRQQPDSRDPRDATYGAYCPDL